MRARMKHTRQGLPHQPGVRHPPISGRPHRARSFVLWILGSAGPIFCVSCASLRVPSSIPEFEPSAWVSVEKEGLDLRAVPLEGRSCYWEVFDENLPALGIVALWVEIRNGRRTPVTLTDARWRLQIPGGKTGSLDAVEVMKRYHSKAGTRIYSTAAEADSRGKLDHLLLAPGNLAAGQSRSGFLFFAVDPEQEVHWSQAARLIAPPIRCAGWRAAIIELPLAYATP